eukprot:85863_1
MKLLEMSIRSSFKLLQRLHCYTNHNKIHYQCITKYYMSSDQKKRNTFMNNLKQSVDDEIDDDYDDNSDKTLITDIISKYNTEYSESSNRDSIISAAQSIPNFQHLYIVQLINPFNSSNKINIIGIRQESIIEQERVANEIKTLLHSIKPKHLIVQLSADRYETHMNNMDINDIENLIPNTYSLNSLLSSKHLTNSTRIGLHLINYVIMNNKIRMNPYLYALL